MDKLSKEHVLSALKKVREGSEKRKFNQTVECTFNLQEVDFKKPDKRVGVDVVLPHGRGKDIKVVLFAKKDLADNSKGKVDRIVTDIELASIGKREGKILANQYDKFLSETILMGTIGKQLGTILGPRKKMPGPVPPDAKALTQIVDRVKKTVIINNKAKGDYVIHVAVGAESQTDEQLADNVLAVVNALTGKLEKAHDNIKTMYLKTTMGKSVKVETKQPKEVAA